MDLLSLAAFLKVPCEWNAGVLNFVEGREGLASLTLLEYLGILPCGSVYRAIHLCELCSLMRMDHGVWIHRLLVAISGFPVWGRCEHSWMRVGLPVCLQVSGLCTRLGVEWP